MRYTHYYRRNIGTGSIVRLQFTPDHYREAGLMPSQFSGMAMLEAHQLINKWNMSQRKQRFVYGLE